MKLSIHTTFSNPWATGYPYKEAIASFLAAADEVVVVNGGDPVSGWHPRLKIVEYPWPELFHMSFYGEQYTRGYEACSGDWAIRLDCDYVLHDNAGKLLRAYLEQHPTEPIVAMTKRQFVVRYRGYPKGQIANIFNRKHFGSRLKFDSGDDLSEPSLDGRHQPVKSYPNCGVHVWNFDHFFKTEEQVRANFKRQAYARFLQKGRWEWGDMDTYMDVFNRTMATKADLSVIPTPLSEHPSFIQDALVNMTPDLHGYNHWGRL